MAREDPRHDLAAELVVDDFARDSRSGTFAYTVNGVVQTKAITLVTFADPVPVCAFGFVPDPALATNYQDLWWNAPAGSESGWGVSLTHQGNLIFAGWFTYDADGRALWLSATLVKVAGATYAGTLIRSTGPAWSATPYDPRQVVRTAVGTASVTFANGNAGAFSYTVNGVTQTKPITRYVYQPPGTVCQ